MHVITLNEFLNTNKNKKIFLAENVSLINDILKAYVKNTKTPIFDIECLTLDDICKKVFLSFVKDLEILNNEEANVLFHTFLSSRKEDIIYSRIPQESLTLSTSKIVYSSINEIRLGKVIKQPDKSLTNIISDFELFLSAKKVVDIPLMYKKVDELLKTKEISKIKTSIGCGDVASFGIFISLFEKLNYSQSELLNILLKIYESEFNVIDFRNDSNKPQIYKSAAYGYMNEVRHVIDCIKENDDIHYSDVSIFVTDSKYENLIKALFENYDITYKFLNGESGDSNDSIVLLRNFIAFLSDHLNINHLYQIYRNKIFKPECVNLLDINDLRSDKKYIDNVINNHKKPWNEYQKEFLNDILSLYECDLKASELFSRLICLYEKYADPKISAVDKHVFIAKEKLIFYMDEYLLDYQSKLKFINESLDGIRVQNTDEINAGYVEISNLSSAKFLSRKYNFILGLSANQFGVKEVESPLISDKEYQEILDVDNYFVNLSSKKNERYIKNIYDLFKTLPSGEINLIRSSYDSSELKNIAPSLLMSNDYKEREAKNHYLDKIIVTESVNKLDEILVEQSIVKNLLLNIGQISPSTLETIITCPLKYIYSAKYGEIDLDEYEGNWLKGPDKGNFVHDVLEQYFKQNNSDNFSESIFEKVFNDEKQKTIAKIPFDNVRKVNFESYLINKMIRRYLERYYKEHKLYPYTPIGFEVPYSNVLIDKNEYKGRIDRVDGLVDEDGVLHLRIIDYKTTSLEEMNKKKKNGSLTQSIIYPLALKNIVKSINALMFDRLPKYKNIDLENITFTYELIRTNKKIEINDLEDKQYQYDSIQSSLIKLNKLLVNPTFANFMDIYTPTLDKETAHKSGRCAYCGYAPFCHLKLKKGTRVIWDNQK